MWGIGDGEKQKKILQYFIYAVVKVWKPGIYEIL